MALRSLLLRWPASAAGLAAASLAAGGIAYCERDVKGPSFDPEALERGAKALREINTSPHAKKVIQLVLGFLLLIWSTPDVVQSELDQLDG